MLTAPAAAAPPPRADQVEDQAPAGPREAGPNEPNPSEPDPSEGSVDASADPEAQAPQTAAQWYAQGIELATAGQLDAAAEAFLRSYELKPTPEALFNAGLALQNADRPIPAIETYERVLAEPTVDATLATAASEAITELRRRVGTLKGVRYAPSRPPVELYVSGRRVELDALPLLVPPGPIVVEVVDEAGERAQETYEIAAGEALVIDLRALLPEPPAPRTDGDLDGGPGRTGGPDRGGPDRDGAQLRLAKGLYTSAWIGLGLTGAAGISAATLAGLAARERRDYLASTCLEFAGGDCPGDFEPGDPEANLRAFEAYRTGAIVSGAVAGGLAVASLTVGLVGRRLSRRADGPRAARIRIEPSAAGLRLRF